MGDIDGFDEDVVAGGDRAGVVDQESGEFGVAGVGHGWLHLERAARKGRQGGYSNENFWEWHARWTGWAACDTLAGKERDDDDVDSTGD